VGVGLSGYQATRECSKSQELLPKAPLVGGQDVAAVVLTLLFVLAECFSAADKAEAVSSQAGRSQSSRIFFALENPLEGSDFLNLSKSSAVIFLKSMDQVSLSPNNVNTQSKAVEFSLIRNRLITSIVLVYKYDATVKEESKQSRRNIAAMVTKKCVTLR
jgi:hypothetical protein